MARQSATVKRKQKAIADGAGTCQRCGGPCFTPPEHSCCRELGVQGPNGYCSACKTSDYLNDEQVKKQQREYLEKQEAIAARKEAGDD